MKNTILVVDDCPIHQQLLKTQAQRRGYDVELLGDGMDAIIRIKENTDNICVILLDIFMPNVDGISTLGQLRNKHPEIPVLIVSNTEDQEITDAAQSLGVQAIIPKPMDEKKIEQIFTLIESHRK